MIIDSRFDAGKHRRSYMDIVIGLIQMLGKMVIFTVFAFAGIFLGKFLRDRKNLKLESASEETVKLEEE